MKKKNILLGLLLAGAAISLVACKGTSNNKTNTGTDPVTTQTGTIPTSNKVTLKFVTDGNPLDDMVVEKGESVGLPTPTKPKKTVNSKTHEAIAYEFYDWYLDADFEQVCEGTFDKDTTLYARWNEVKSAEDGYDFIQAQVNLSKYGITDTLESDFKRSIFNFAHGILGRSRTNTWTCEKYDDFEDVNKFDTLISGEYEYMFTHSFKLSSAAHTITFTAREDGYVRAYVQNGSSKATTAGLKVAASAGSYNLYIPANYGEIGNPVVQACIEVEKGETYTISSIGATTLDIYCIETEYITAESDPDYISIDVLPQVNFLTGQDFDYNGLEVDLNYENGKIEKIDAYDEDLDVEVGSINTPGNYDVTLTYKDLDSIKYSITVSDLNSFATGIYEDKLLMEETSVIGDPIYFNYSLKRIYHVGDKLDLEHLTINAYDKLGNLYLFPYYDDCIEYEVKDSSNKKVGNEDYTFTAEGKYNIQMKLTVGNNSVTNTLDVNVVSTEPTYYTKDNEDILIVAVNKDYTGEIGAVGQVDGKNCNQFKSIQQALEYIASIDGIENNKKEILLAPGNYYEKLEITIPNLTLRGITTDKSDVLIEWNSVYGVPDASGFYQERDSSQTVAVREQAINCRMENLTISNYYNSSTRCDGLKDTRALALLVQSDKFVMYNCALLGYQDTVNFFYGRQYIYKSYISGITDFIFGTNNTTLFENCEIHTVGGKSNGYVTAFMGCSKGEEDRVDYGTIFSNCNFTADSNVEAGTISLGRCWGPYPAVAFLNCNMGAHISTAEADGSTAGKRYVSLAVSPLSEGTNFVEYANSGSGAVDHTIAGMTYLTEDEAANYLDVTIIFGTKNGNVKYPDVWNCFALFN